MLDKKAKERIIKKFRVHATDTGSSQVQIAILSEEIKELTEHLKIHNGMQLMLYMTMITSMLVLIYKRANDVGYKTAVRRISFELNEFIIRLVVKHLGGDPKQAFRRNPELDRVFKKEDGLTLNRTTYKFFRTPLICNPDQRKCLRIELGYQGRCTITERKIGQIIHCI